METDGKNKQVDEMSVYVVLVVTGEERSIMKATGERKGGFLERILRSDCSQKDIIEATYRKREVEGRAYLECYKDRIWMAQDRQARRWHFL